MKYFLFISFSTFLLASSYPHFSKKEFIYIQKHSGKMAKNRALDYQETINKFSKDTKEKQLNEVNFYLNQLLPQYDSVMQHKEDYWESPKEFLVNGYGDCEDYVIIKYFTLLKLGFDKKKLFMTTVREKFSGGNHMVLCYFPEEGKSPLVLDNLSFKILPLNIRVDLKSNRFINHNGVYIINKKNKLKKIYSGSIQYVNLLKKIQKEN